ncbi:hypothetical protein OG723_38470 [Streptomyces sp. NBC_01278]|uniref:hypothetical protein n=1 Tax=Streptomyces sp. NBC_01278 TaxID=2903809 RepID=UPI002E34AA73|nr:hypothetical protein [Streptomyces sp. NBC_01278]
MGRQAIPEELGQHERVFVPGRQGGSSTARRRKSVNVTVGVVTAGFAAVTAGMLLAGKPLPLALLPLVLGGAAFEWIRRHSLWTINQEPYDEVELYENGLLCRAGGKQRHMLWSEVTEYWVRAYEPPTKFTADGPEPTRFPGTKAVFRRASNSDFEVMLSGLEAGGDFMAVAAERVTAETAASDGANWTPSSNRRDRGSPSGTPRARSGFTPGRASCPARRSSTP